MATPAHLDYSFYISVGAAVVSFVSIAISVYMQYITSRKTTYINVITSARLKWMGELRESVSKLCGLTYHWAITTGIEPQENQQILKEIDRLSFLIQLQLTPDNKKHDVIKALVDAIPDNTDRSKLTILMEKIEGLKVETRLLLRDTWVEVKKEAGEEELTKAERLKSWMLTNVIRKVFPKKDAHKNGTSMKDRT